MGETTGISWCDHTFNPWIGCSKVSPGCANCYAERENKRYGWVDGGWGPKGHRKRTSTENWKKPLAWDKAAKLAGVRRKVFCASLADVFEDRPELIPWRAELFDLICDTPNLDWLLLTKRPENVNSMFERVYGNYDEDGVIIPDNVWLGVTAENQAMADERIPLLMEIPASVRFVSVEPMLGDINLSNFIEKINWVICGGESGPGARPLKLWWCQYLRDQCEYSGVPFFFKQISGKLKHLEDFPEDLRVREFPV